MIGTQEILVILIVILLIVIACSPFVLKKYYPNKKWVGLSLCLLLTTGQFYLEGGLKYFITLFILYVVLKQFTSMFSAILVDNLISVGIMYWRFLKLDNSIC